MNREDQALVRETKALIAEVEAGDVARAAWTAIQDRVKRLYKGRTQTEVGELLDRSGYWVGTMLQWNPSRDGKPFAKATPEAKGRGTVEAKRVLENANSETIEKLISTLEPEQVKVISDVADDIRAQQHPATAKRAPLGMPKEQTYGFTLEMGKSSQRLKRAIDEYVEAWDRHVGEASEDEKQTERDLIAPSLLSLRMTVEGVEV